MFKLVVLCAFVAFVAAEPEPEPQPQPGALIAPFQTYASVLTPAATTYTNQASSVVHPSPYIVSSPFVYSHYIKKRSAPLSYIAPSPYTTYPLPYAGAYGAPLYNAASILPAPAVPYFAAGHLIKKRSAPFLPTTYFGNYGAHSPLIASTYTSPLLSSPLIPQPVISQPLISTHFIKKRSAPIFPAVSTYLAPSSYSHQSRIDLQTSPVYTYPSYSHPIAYSHVF